MNIVLIGMRGSGKSTVGEILSRKLGWKYIEVDRLIEKEAGQKISGIVSRFGWKKFRSLESIAIRNLNTVDRAIIATGGGVVLNKENMRILKNNSITVFLQASVPVLTQRCKYDRNRPFLTETATMEEDLSKTFSKRKGLYDKYSDLTILNENKPVSQTVNEFLHRKICCIIGHPVSHSLSPSMHNAVYKKLGLNYLFLAFDATDLKSSVESIRDLKITGTAVTVPHKIKVMAYLDKVDETAKIIGAVNTILRSNGDLVGTNTDWSAAIDALKEKTTLAGKSVALLGAGGAARAIAYGLKKEGTFVSVFNRNIDHARSLVDDFGLVKPYSLNVRGVIGDCDIVINATSVGLDSNDTPIGKNELNPSQIVFDIVYSPKMTRLLKIAKAVGCSIITGERMLLHCVKRQFELFTGCKAPLNVMERILSC